jgi:glutamine phosphoribosylpyrophosphate amidotransferase
VCGLAGFSLKSAPESAPERDANLLARLLLAGIAERGDDACGYAFPGKEGVVVSKVRGGASNLVRVLSLPPGCTQTLVHVREHTKGTPSLEANNHPIRHGRVVGIHNGRLLNDDELFSVHGLERQEPGMTVDSEALFALIDRYPDEVNVLGEAEGALAIAWLDERRPGVLSLARGWGRPLLLGESDEGLFFASTRFALEMMAEHVGISLSLRAVPEGTVLSIVAGEIVAEQAFEPRPAGKSEEEIASPSPYERERCLQALMGPVAALSPGYLAPA